MLRINFLLFLDQLDSSTPNNALNQSAAENLTEKYIETGGTEIPERVEELQSSEPLMELVLSNQDHDETLENEGPEQIEDNETSIREEISNIPTTTVRTASVDDEPTTTVVSETQDSSDEDRTMSSAEVIKKQEDDFFHDNSAHTRSDDKTQGSELSSEGLENMFAQLARIVDSITEPVPEPEHVTEGKVEKSDGEQAIHYLTNILQTLMEDAELEQKKHLQSIDHKPFEYTTSASTDGEDVVSEVVKVDEETTELHQVIKKPGVDGTTDDNQLKSIKVTNIESNDLQSLKTIEFEGRSFIDNDEPVDPLRTLVEGVELTADITKTVDNFQSFSHPNDSIQLAANQVIETGGDVVLVESEDFLTSVKESAWCVTNLIYGAAGFLTFGLILLLIVSYLRLRQFKRNVLFTCWLIDWYINVYW